jgi:hypothetical protein
MTTNITTNINIASMHAAASAGANAATVVLPNTNAIAGAEADTPNDVSIDTAQAPDMSAAIPQEDVALEFHEYANIFPELSDDRLAELAEDIREHGLLDKIDLYDGKILDGRGRYRACRMAGVDPQYEDFKGADPLAYVASRNRHRRDLDPSQRAMVAAKIANFKVGANQHSEGDSKLVAAVESGELTVAAAAALAHNQAAGSSDKTAPSLNSPTASTNDGSAPAAEPSPDASTMVETATVTGGSASLTDLPLREVTRRPAFKLPKPGVTFLGTLVHVKEQVGLDANGFPFQLRNRNCVPAVSWEGLSADITNSIAAVPNSISVK